MTAKKLWACVVSHQDVPGDHLVLVRQQTEPSDSKVRSVMVGNGTTKADAAAASVTHSFNLGHWRMHYNNRHTMASFIADGGMGTQ